MLLHAYILDKLYPRAGAQAVHNCAVLVADGNIIWLGPARSCPDVPRTHLSGVAYPGFIDSHVHLTATGLDLLALNAGRFSAIADLLEAINELDREREGVVRVWGYEPEIFRERRYPTLQELDKACPRNLLWINHIESHGTIVNSRSLAALGLPAFTALLTGEHNQMARQFFLENISFGEREQAVMAAAELAVSRGLTSLHAMEGGRLFHNLDMEAVLALQNRLPVSVQVYPQILDVEWAKARGLGQIGGCLPLDGSSGVYTAALSQPYHGRTDQGQIYYSREAIQDFVLHAQQQGMQAAMHACGDAAIDLFLDAVEHAQNRSNAFIPHRVEHFELARADQVERCVRLGVILSMQPAFDWFWGGPQGDYARTQGPKGWQDANPIGWAVQAGLVVAGGSDSGVTPLDPLLGIQAALSHHNPEQRVSLNQAVAMFTENGAKAARQQDRGRLEPGLRADLVVLDGDLGEHPEPTALQVVATINRGEIVWAQKNRPGR